MPMVLFANICNSASSSPTRLWDASTMRTNCIWLQDLRTGWYEMSFSKQKLDFPRATKIPLNDKLRLKDLAQFWECERGTPWFQSHPILSEFWQQSALEVCCHRPEPEQTICL